MNKLLIKFKVILFLVIILAATVELSAQKNYKERVFRIKFTESSEAQLNTMSIQKSADGIVRTGIASIDRLSQKYGASNMRRVFPYAGKFEEKHKKHGLHLWYEIVIDKKSDVRVASQEYHKLTNVSVSELILNKAIGGTTYNSYKLSPLGSLPGGTNDPLYNQQWHYNNTGQTGGTVDADIDLPEAWAIQTGANDVIVSVHDGGIDIDHEDLAGNMWINQNEIAGNGIDDDNNGYVDDINGYNFGDNTGTIYANDHGTHVAGTVAAETNNGIGMSGIAGGSGSDDGIRLMSCAVFGNSNTGGFATSYIYAADNGSVISQNSWGYTSPNVYEQAVLDAIDYFIAEAGTDENGIQNGPMAGGLVIFAAGNSGTDDLWYPGYYEPIIAVAGTDHNDNSYNNSNRGAWVDIAAPAVNIFSTIPDNNYTGGYTGTSMACPHVSGVAALVLSQFKDAGITPQQVRDRMVNSTDVLTFTGAEDWGSGRVNAFKALAEDDGMPPVAISDMAVNNISAISVTFSWTTPADQPQNLPATLYDFRYSLNPITDANFNQATSYNIAAPQTPGSIESVIVEGLSAGTTYYFAVKSADYFGNTSQISNTVTATTNFAPEIVITGNPGVSIDISVNPIETGVFTIQNQGQAELSYDIFPVYMGSIAAQVQSTLIYPGTEVSINPQTNYQGIAELSGNTAVNNNNVAQFDFSNNMANMISYDDGDEEADGTIAVTASGTPVVWSAATAFDVPDFGGEKFILSHVNAYFNASGSASSNPTSVSIIAGGDVPSAGELIMMQEFTNVIGTQYVTIPLEMPVSFETGDKFWIVFNFPAAPLRLGYDDVTNGNRPGAYMVYLNGGWLDIQTQSGWSNYVWNVRAIQTELQGVSIDFTNGTVDIGSTQNIAATYDATGVTRNGNYNFNFFVLSNDPVSPVEKIESIVAISGLPEPVIDIQPDTINSTINVSVNPVKTEILTIYNTGEGNLQFDFENPVVEQQVNIPPFTGEYTKGNAPESSGIAPFVSSETNSSIPVTQFAESTVYGHEVYPGAYFVSFSTDNPATYLTSSATTYTAFAGDFAKGDDNHMYIIDNDVSELKKLNIETGDLETIGAILGFTDLASDKNEGIMYGAFYASPSTSLYSIDLSTGAATLIGTMGDGIMISIACDGDGNLWGLNLDDNIYAIDKTDGHMTLVGAAGFDANYAQSMAWDPASGIVYLAAYNLGSNSGELRVLDTETGATQLVGVFPGNAEITAFGFPGGGSVDFVTVSPTSGTVAANSSTTVQVELDATTLPNGLYNSSLTVYSNDLNNLSTVVPVNLDVSGQTGDIVVDNVFIEFGAVFLNGEKEIPFTISNVGIGGLEISEISSNMAMFTTNFMDTTVLAKDDSLTVKVKFASNFLGQFNGIITVKSNDPNNPEMQITVTATAISPPVISLNPTEVETTLDAGQQTVNQFTIYNYGMYPLQFSMPTVAATMLLNNANVQRNNTSFIEGLAESDEKELNFGNNGYPVQLGVGGPDDLGYSWIDSRELGGPVYNWEEISVTGTEIVPNSDDGSVELDLPFGFKFYGELKTSVRVSSNGYLTFTTTGGDYTNDQIPNTKTPNNFIAPFWDDLRPSSKRGQVFYQAFADKFIVQYQECGNYPSSTTGTITFQVVLFPNGNIQYYYKEITLENNASATIGSENLDGTVGLQVAFNTDFVENNLAVLIFPGRTPFDVTVDKISGIVQPNSEQLINVTVDASNLMDGNYINELLITNNDPIRSEETYTTKLDVIGHPEISVSPDSLLFSSIFQSLNEVKNITIENTGTKSLIVSNISSNNQSFTIDFANPVFVAPMESITVEITYTAINIGEVTGSITIESDDEFGNQSYQIYVSGTGLVPPEIVLTTNPSPLDIVMNSGDIDTVNVSVQNIGGSTLNYVMIKPAYTKLGNVTVNAHTPAPDLTTKEQADTRVGDAVQLGSGGPDSFGYTWVDNDEGAEVSYDWIEISEIGTNLNLGADNGTYVSLPFGFPFYNQTYNQVQIASNGFFTFSDALGSIGGWSNQDIPSSTDPNNLIAPLWDDLEPQNGDGVYLYSTPEYIIVQYNDIPAYTGTGNATFQAIIYANGNIKFQYKDVMNYAGLNKSTVGLENEDGTDALQIVFNNTYVKDGLAVLIKSPFVIGSVDPGLTANIDLIVDATDIYDGVYESPLKVLSNDIVNPIIEIPTTLTVTGTPEISTSTDSVLFNQLFYVDGENFSDTKSLVITNVGSKSLLIDSMWFSTTSGTFTANKSGSFELEPKAEMLVGFTFTPNTVGSFSNTFNIASNDLANPLVSALLIGNAIAPPIFSVNPTDTLKLELISTGYAEETSVVSNLGASLLGYDANIMYLPNGFNETSQEIIFNRTEINFPAYKSLSQINNVSQSSVYQLFDVNFSDSIVYDPNLTPDDYYGYNGGAQYSSANRFIVTSQTFNLTHISNYYQNGGVTDAVILQVYKGGGNPEEGILLTTQAFTNPEATAGKNCLIELDNPQLFVQGDEFFVVIHYPQAIQFPAGFNWYADNVDGVSYWFDVNSSAWIPEDEGTVYKIRAFEAVGQEPTEWLIVNPQEGELEAGQTENSNLKVTASATTGGYHYAKVVYTSNDPVTPTIEWPIQLYVNYLPEIVSAPDTIYVNEGQTVQMMVVANDPESGALAFEFAEIYEFTQLEMSGDTAIAMYSPDYEQAGIHNFTMNVTDNKGESISVSWAVVVNNVNRTPVLITDIEDRMYFIDDATDNIDLSYYLIDPDGEALIYEVFSNTDSAFTLVIDDNVLEINPIALGFDVVTVTARDSEGAYAAASFNVRVRHSENHAPILVQMIPDQIVSPDGPAFLDLDDYFTDIDWDEIEYSFSISGRPSVIATLEDSELTLERVKYGMCILTIYADDNRGGITAVSISVFVTGRANRMPKISSEIGDREYSLSQETEKINLNEFFNDPDNDNLVYMCVVNDGNSVVAVVKENILEISPEELGESTITLYASDERTGIVKTSFKATVNSTTGILDNEDLELSLSNYPNPFTNRTTIQYEVTEKCNVHLKVMSIYGKTIEVLVDKNQPSGKYTIDYNAHSLSSGIYFYQLTIDNERTIIKRMLIE